MTRASCEVVLLTPPGRGAVATVLVAGEGATEKVACFFRPAANKPLASFPLGRIVFGRWDGDAVPSNEYSVHGTPYATGEEIVVCRTSETEVEIHCHGGAAASRAIINTLVAVGCEEVDWQSHTRSTSPDRIAADAQIALAAATTTKTAAILLDQFHGALRREIAAIVAACETGDQALAVERLEVLQSRGPVGLQLTQPFRVVLAGRPNVGKSSLMNAILGYTRAIVFDQPGTTRDVVSAATAIDGWPVELSDTAGLRASTDEVEAEGVARARRAAAEADLLVLVFDASQPWTNDDQALVDAYATSLVVHNKCDLRAVGLQTCPALPTSTVSGEGIATLIRTIGERLVPAPPTPGDAVPFTQVQSNAIAHATRLALSGELASAADTLRELLR